MPTLAVSMIQAKGKSGATKTKYSDVHPKQMQLTY